MLEDEREGWWGAPAGKRWRCPECNKISNISDWNEVSLSCEDCGSHDGRECPTCGEAFDHVWDADKIKSGDIEEPNL